jgi:hypothetical protein
VAYESIKHYKSGSSVNVSSGRMKRKEGQLLEAGNVIFIEVKEIGAYSALIFLWLPPAVESSSSLRVG